VRPARASPRVATAAGTAATATTMTRPVGSSQISKTGRLLKASNGGWKTRWVELQSIAAEASEELNAVWIVYRKNEQSTRDLGGMNLTGCSMMAATRSSAESGGVYLITLVSKATSERLVFAAESEDVYAAWTAALHSVGVVSVGHEYA
jgi:hypothetical protein